MENVIECSPESTKALGYWIDKIGIPDPNYLWNNKIHYLEAPQTHFQILLFISYLERKAI